MQRLQNQERCQASPSPVGRRADPTNPRRSLHRLDALCGIVLRLERSKPLTALAVVNNCP